MSLKTEIDKTNELKNKTKKAKDNINAKLTELGGQNANNLADVPSKINELASQYKKYAEINVNQIRFSGYTTLTIPLNLSFEPIEIFISVRNITREDYSTGGSHQNHNRGFYITRGTNKFEIFFNGEKNSYTGFDITVREFSKKNLILYIKSLDDTNYYLFYFNKAYILG